MTSSISEPGGDVPLYTNTTHVVVLFFLTCNPVFSMVESQKGMEAFKKFLSENFGVVLVRLCLIKLNARS